MTSLSHLTAEELAAQAEQLANEAVRAAQAYGEEFDFAITDTLRECAARLRGKVPREPTGAMVKANHTGPIYGSVEEGWIAMWDAAVTP